MSEALRILYHHRIRADDGQAVHVRELIAALRRQGHEVLECALVPKADGPQGDGAQTAAPGADNAPPHRSFWQRLALPRTAVECLEVFYNVRGRAMLRAAARRLRPHFVYERHALHCRAGLDVARELGVPLLLEVNSPMVHEMRRLGLLRLPRRAVRTERSVLAGADRVLAVTEVLARMLEPLGADRRRLRVIGNGAQPERYDAPARAAGVALRRRLALPPDAFVLGFVGYVRPWHRLDLLLEVMARAEFARLHLLLLGDGPALPALGALASRLGVAGRFHRPGRIAPDALPAHLLAADAALIAAINDYASPLKLFDALAAGLPVLAPDQPNLRETIEPGRNGLLFAPDQVESLAAALRGLLADAAAARRIGAQGLRDLRERSWTWDGNAARVIGEYGAVMAERGSR